MAISTHSGGKGYVFQASIFGYKEYMGLYSSRERAELAQRLFWFWISDRGYTQSEIPRFIKRHR